MTYTVRQPSDLPLVGLADITTAEHLVFISTSGSLKKVTINDVVNKVQASTSSRGTVKIGNGLVINNDGLVSLSFPGYQGTYVATVAGKTLLTVTVDNTGRTTGAVANSITITPNDIDGLLISDGLNPSLFPTATTSSAGIITVGAGLSVTSGTVSLPTVGTSGTYTATVAGKNIVSVTTDNRGRVTNLISSNITIDPSDITGLISGGQIATSLIPFIAPPATESVTTKTFSGLLRVTDTTASTSSTTGSVVISGGTGIAGRLNVGGVAAFTDGTQSSSTTTGAVTISGGLGVGLSITSGQNITATGNISCAGLGTSANIACSGSITTVGLTASGAVAAASVTASGNISSTAGGISTNSGNITSSSGNITTTSGNIQGTNLTASNTVTAVNANITGATTTSSLNVSGNQTVGGTLGITGNLTAQSKIFANSSIDLCNFGTFTVGGVSTTFYPVRFTLTSPFSIPCRHGLKIFRTDKDLNGTNAGTFYLDFQFAPTVNGKQITRIVNVFYDTGLGTPYNDPLGDIQDGSSTSNGTDVIVWLRGGGTYNWSCSDASGSWILTNGNSGGTSITDSSGTTRATRTTQSSLVTTAKTVRTIPIANLQISNTDFFSGLITKSGSSIATVSSAVATINYNTPFPNGVLSVIACNGDANVGDYYVTVFAINNTGFIVKTPGFASGSFRFNWVAIGY